MASILLALFVQALSTSVRAEVQITGGLDAIRVEARDVPVEELLTALSKAYGLQYRSSANLSPSVSGTFAGSLEQVLSRVLLLQGYDFLAETSEHGTIVAIYDKGTAHGSDVNLVTQTAPVPRWVPPPPMHAPLPRGAGAAPDVPMAAYAARRGLDPSRAANRFGPPNIRPPPPL
jgi:hypothetical protein